MSVFVWKIETVKPEEVFLAFDGTDSKLYQVKLDGSIMSVSLLEQEGDQLTFVTANLSVETVNEIANQITPDGVEEFKTIEETRYILTLAKD